MRHRVVIMRCTPSALCHLPTLKQGQTMIRNANVIVCALRLVTVQMKCELAVRKGNNLQRVPKSAIGPVVTHGRSTVSRMLLHSAGQCVHGDRQRKCCYKSRYPATAPGTACEVTKLLRESDDTPTCMMLGAKQVNILSNDLLGQNWPIGPPSIKTIGKCTGNQIPSLTITMAGQIGNACCKKTMQIASKFLFVLSLPIGRIIHWSWYLSSVRIGEAANPGPARPPGICISAFNPTSVYQRSQHLSECGDIVLLSETSATLQVQKVETRALRTLGMRSVWSQPVEPHKVSDTSVTSLRGASRGTACLSRYPIRETRDPFPPAWCATGRISECYVQIGPLQIRLITIYGFAKGTPNGLSMTNFLLEAATQRLQLNRTPTIIGGDINRPVETLKAWTQLKNQGYVELHAYAASALGTPTEPTCVSRKTEGPGTRNDTLLIDPRLVPYLTHVRVEIGKAISVHRPAQAFFQLPKEQIKALRWRLPKDFAGLGLNLSQLDEAYVEANPEPRVESARKTKDELIDWTRKLEKTIDSAIARQHSSDPVLHPFPGLPKASKGRCIKRRAIMLPIANPCRHARHNDYQPPGEAVTIRSKHRVRQARRLRSLLQLELGTFISQSMQWGVGVVLAMAGWCLSTDLVRQWPGRDTVCLCPTMHGLQLGVEDMAHCVAAYHFSCLLDEIIALRCVPERIRLADASIQVHTDLPSGGCPL